MLPSACTAPREGRRYHETWSIISLFFLGFALPAFFYLPRDRKNSVSVFSAAVKAADIRLTH